jgi:Protein of unknown function (DUF2867)
LKPRITAANTPATSVLLADIPSAYFHDCYQTPLNHKDKTQSAMALYLKVVASTPTWVNTMMLARNRVVAWFGLKNLGLLSDIDPHKAASAYVIGERVGIFSVLHLSESEVVLGDSDKHLRAQISICKTVANGHACLAVSTVVHVHNTLGKLYLLFVVPMHKIIVPAMMLRMLA